MTVLFKEFLSEEFQKIQKLRSSMMTHKCKIMFSHQ